MKVNKVNKVNGLPFSFRIVSTERIPRLPLPRRTLENTHLKVNRLTTRVNIEDFEQSRG